VHKKETIRVDDFQDCVFSTGYISAGVGWVVKTGSIHARGEKRIKGGHYCQVVDVSTGQRRFCFGCHIGRLQEKKSKTTQTIGGKVWRRFVWGSGKGKPQGYRRNGIIQFCRGGALDEI